MSGKRILIRAPKVPELALTPEASLAHGSNGVFGSNTGNMLFADSVFRTISVPGTQIVPDSYSTERQGSDASHAARIDDEFDMFVVPLANAFREEFRRPLQRLTTVIQHLTIPVVVTGIGAQLPPSGAVEDVSEGLRTDVKAFMSAVLDRSSSVGVRGDITARFLHGLGFGNDAVDVIGCPSMFDFRGEAPVVDKRVGEISSDDPIALNVNPKAPWAAELLRHHFGTYRDCVYVPQENSELALLLWGQRLPRALPGMPATADDPWIRDGRVRFFLDTRIWHEFMAQRVFSFGHRIHGSIAALAAGTPACVLTFDSRTVELVDYHGIPQVPCHALNDRSIDARALYDAADFSTMNARRGPTRDAFLAFLSKNGVAHVESVDTSADDSVDDPVGHQRTAADLPDGVGRDVDLETLAERVRWLWNETRRTNPDRYLPPFSPAPPRSVDARLAALEKRCDRLSRTVKKLSQENEALRAKLTEVAAPGDD